MLYIWWLAVAGFIIIPADAGLIFSNFTPEDLAIKHLINWSLIPQLRLAIDGSNRDNWAGDEYSANHDYEPIDELIANHNYYYNARNTAIGTENNILSSGHYPNDPLHEPLSLDNQDEMDRFQLQIEIAIYITLAVILLVLLALLIYFLHSKKQKEESIKHETEKYISAWRAINEYNNNASQITGDQVYIVPRPGREEFEPIASPVPPKDEGDAAILPLEKMKFNWSASF